MYRGARRSCTWERGAHVTGSAVGCAVLVTEPTALDRLHKKTRKVAERNLAGDEHVVTVVKGRSKQAMVVTDRQLLIIKAGSMAGVGFRAKATTFSLEDIAAINVHTGPGIA